MSLWVTGLVFSLVPFKGVIHGIMQLLKTKDLVLRTCDVWGERVRDIHHPEASGGQGAQED